MFKRNAEKSATRSIKGAVTIGAVKTATKGGNQGIHADTPTPFRLNPGLVIG